ncbi:hypothetical protein [Neobacillus mesonae]|nr:hypothetical protein [Neobacillus mesonae]
MTEIERVRKITYKKFILTILIIATAHTARNMETTTGGRKEQE